MNNLPSLKKALIIAFATAAQPDLTIKTDQEMMKEFKRPKLILLTPAGILKGYIKNHDPKELRSTILETALNTYHKHNHTDNEDPMDFEGFLDLECVELVTANGTAQNFDYLTVFFEEIIGVTIENIDQ